MAQLSGAAHISLYPRIFRLKLDTTALQDGGDEITAEKPPTFDEAEGMLNSAEDAAAKYGLDECEYLLVDPKFNTRVLNSE
jgi:hypothetical protein